MKKFGLLPRVIVAIVFGIGIGLIIPVEWLSLTEVARNILSGILKFFIPLIILAFIGAGIADFRDKVGKLLSASVTIAYIDTVIAIGIACAAAAVIVPRLVSQGQASAAGREIPEPFMKMDIEPPLAILTALLLAFLLGIGAAWDKSTTTRKLLFEFRDIVMWGVSNILLPLIPFVIFFTFIKLSAEGTVFNNLPVFFGMFILIVLLQWGWLAVEYGLAGLVARRNPFRMIKAMAPAYLTGMGTMSSAVTMPVALRQAKMSGVVSTRIAEFGIPLFNTVHQAAAGIGIAVGAMTVAMIVNGEMPSVGVITAFVLLLAVIEVGAVGIPGGSILASMGVLSGTLGFGETELALMLTLFAIQDSFATAGNVVGDGALTMIIDKYFGQKKTNGTQAVEELSTR